MNGSSMGSLFGGLAGGFAQGLNDREQRANTAARTAATEAGTAQLQNETQSAKDFGQYLRGVDAWVANGRQGPRPVPRGAIDIYGILGDPIGPSFRPPVARSEETPHFADALKQKGFHVLADAITGSGTDDDPMPMLTQPASSAAGLGLTQPSPAIPNLTQITGQAMGPATGMKKFGILPETFGA